MKRLILDTNVIVRFLIAEPTPLGKAAARLFEKSDHQEITLILEPLVLAESIFVLTSFYKRTRLDVAAAMEVLINSPGIECLRRRETEIALRNFRAQPSAHWVDCFLAASSEKSGHPVVSFDHDFDHPTGSTRVDPAQH